MSAKRNAWLGILALGLAFGTCFWLLQVQLGEAQQAATSSHPSGAKPAASQAESNHGAVHQGEAPRAQPSLAAAVQAAPPLAEAPQRPHPITPIHEELAKQRELIAALEDALQHKRYDQARQLLGEADDLADGTTTDAVFGQSVRGYRLILECLTARASTRDGSGSLPAELRQATQKYLDTHRLPPRREVRRVCLEGRPFARRA